MDCVLNKYDLKCETIVSIAIKIFVFQMHSLGCICSSVGYFIGFIVKYVTVKQLTWCKECML